MFKILNKDTEDIKRCKYNFLTWKLQSMRNVYMGLTAG